ncbi:MAG: winged helix-turn-helix transcriptional regulator [Hamadaea sp.]|nr:winged helix-turn-helix transcriptional regulator [Hamadaea sp.]
MLRVHFTAADLARVRIAAEPDPLWELALSMHVLRVKEPNPLLAGWKGHMLRRLHPAGAPARQLAVPFALNPPLGYFPDFLTPYDGLQGLDAGLAALVSTPAMRLRAEVGKLADRNPAAAPLVDDVRTGRAPALRALETSLRSYHATAVAPYWDRITSACTADRAMRIDLLASAGAQALLDSLGPRSSFRGGVLEVTHFRRTQEVHLDGRGLMLIPSYFKEDDTVMLLADVDLPPVLIYPIDRDIRVRAEARKQSLSALIGKQRAEILELAGGGFTVSDIARRLDLTPSGVSRHLAVLRDAGLLTGVRDRNALRHVLSPLGTALLQA